MARESEEFDGRSEDGGDWLLLERIAQNDRSAFKALYDKHYRRVFRFLFRMTRNLELAEEALNDAMMVVWDKANSFSRRSKVATWITGIAYRKGLKLMQKNRVRKARFPVGEAFADIELENASGEPITEEVQRDWLEAGLNGLSAEHRAVVELTYFHGYSYQEISLIVNCPVNTVKTRMFHARERLRESLPGLAAMPAGTSR